MKKEAEPITSSLVPTLQIAAPKKHNINKVILSDPEYAYIYDLRQKSYSFLQITKAFNAEFKSNHSKRGLEEAFKRQTDVVVSSAKEEAKIDIYKGIKYDYEESGKYIFNMMFLLEQKAQKAFIENDTKLLLNICQQQVELRKVQIMERTRIQEITAEESTVLSQKTLELVNSKILKFKETGIMPANVLPTEQEYNHPVLPSHLRND